MMEYLKAFLVGGAICAAVQILIDKTKLMPGRVMVILVCTGAVLGFIKLGSKGMYESFTDWAGAGASVPLTGFGNVLFKGVKEAVDKDGLLGIFKGGFTASAVGISAALVFSYIASWFFNAKMKS
jgi:stage V sporulation protein AE